MYKFAFKSVELDIFGKLNCDIPSRTKWGETGHIRGRRPNQQHPSSQRSSHNLFTNQQKPRRLNNNHNAPSTLRRPIHRPRSPNRRLHPSNRSLLHQTPRHDPRDFRIRRRSRAVSKTCNLQPNDQASNAASERRIILRTITTNAFCFPLKTRPQIRQPKDKPPLVGS